jgi:hypothetical protein
MGSYVLKILNAPPECCYRITNATNLFGPGYIAIDRDPC